MAEAITLQHQEGVLRELGLNELFYETLSKRFDMSYYFEYAVLNSNCLITRDDLEESLRILINFQPFLRVNVVSRVNKDKPPTRKNPRSEFQERLYFAPCKVDFTDVLRLRPRVTNNDLVEMVCEEEEFLSREERYGDGPRWRLVVNKPQENELREAQHNYKYELLFRMHHQFSDGVSGYDIVYRQFLPILNKVLNQLPVDEVFMKPLDLTPTYEEDILEISNSADKHPAWYVKSGLSLWRAKNRLFHTDSLGFPPIYSEGAPFEDKKGAGIFKYSFGRNLVQKILHERKEKNVTVHSILLTGFSYGMIRLLQDRGLPLPKEITHGWTIDSRKKLDKYCSPQPLGMFIGTSGLTSMKVPKPYRFDKDIFWHNAKKIGNKVLKNVRNQHEKITLDFIAYFTEQLQHESAGKIFAEVGINYHFGLSNLGKCAPGSDMDTSLPKLVDADEIYFGLLGNGLSDFLINFFNTAVNHKGQIFFMMMYSKRWVERDLPEKFFKYAEEVLNEVCLDPQTVGNLN